MSNKDTYVWIGPANGAMSQASNWFDTVTKAVATTAPDLGNTLEFKSGTFSATCNSGDGSLGFGGGKLVLLDGAHVTLDSKPPKGPASEPGNFGFGNITVESGADLAVSGGLAGASLDANSATVMAGGTLDTSHAAIIAHALGIYAMQLGTLRNAGIVRLAGEVGNPSIGRNPNHPGPGFVQTGGFTVHESVTPGRASLLIDLGTVHHGRALTALQLGADNPNDAPGYSALAITAHGNGFTPHLLASIAAAQNSTPTVGGYVWIGTLDVGTSVLGSHSEVIALEAGGKVVETLTIIDKVV